MPSLELGPIPGRRWLDCQQRGEPYEFEPRSNCHEPISATLAALGLGEAAAGTGAAAVLGGAGETALLTSVGIPVGVEAGLPTAAAATSSLPSLSTVGTVLSAGGTLLQTKSGLDQAAYQSGIQRAEAEALKQKANEDAAAAERQQITQNRQTDLVLSRARAVGAASGTDAASPDILNTEGQIAEQGQYNALSSLYEGQQRSRGDLIQSDIDLYNARRITDAAPVAAGGTILRGFSDAFDRLRSGRRSRPGDYFDF